MILSTATSSLIRKLITQSDPNTSYYLKEGIDALARLDEIPGLSDEIIELSEDQIKQCLDLLAISWTFGEDLKAFLDLSKHPTLGFDKAMKLVDESDNISDLNGAIPRDLEVEQLKAELVKANQISRESASLNNYGFLYLVRGICEIVYTLYGRDQFVEITRHWVENTYSHSMLNYCRLFEGWDEVREYPIEWAIEIVSKKAS